jgi:hypothetical protein
MGYSRILRRIVGSYAISPITNPTRSDLESKPLFRDEKPATNRLSHGTAPLSNSLGTVFFNNNFSVCDKTEGTSRDSVYNNGCVYAICKYEGQTAMQTLKITRSKISMCSQLFLS